MENSRKLKVLRAKSAGFCWGVERAIDIARDIAVNQQKPVYTDGPLIHNRQMMEKLTQEGISEVGDYQSKSEVSFTEEQKEDAVVVVRAHGISPERRQYLKSLGTKFKDATCPDVGIIAGKIRLHAKKGYTTIIFGNPEHPEVIGLKGYTEGKGYVIQSTNDIDKLPELPEDLIFVSQSTMFVSDFKKLGEYLKSKYPTLLIFDTICGATKERQSDVVLLAEQGAEAIVVIGGSHSANTIKLVKLVELQNLPAFHIETVNDLDLATIQQFATVGVTAGASTPEFLIDGVCEKLQSLDSLKQSSV